MKNKSKIINQKSRICVYCTIPEIKARTIVENKLAWAFPTNIPIVPGHILISPKRCVAKFEDMTKKEVEAVFNLLYKLKTTLKVSFKATGFNYAWNEGELAGQSVPHFHLHVLPRKAGDTGITKYEPREFLYRPGSREASPEKELLKVTKLIKNNLK
ncbi:MAG: HIT domain-containing protein [Patescibacteria group bacterium]